MLSFSGLPHRNKVADFTNDLFNGILPVVADPSRQIMLDELKFNVCHQFTTLLNMVLKNYDEANAACDALFDKLPSICECLRKDAELIVKFDPAAYSFEEVLVTYPGFLSIAIHRMSHVLYKRGVPILPRMMSEWAHSATGIDINPGAQIGRPFFIDHGTGVVIGETAIIGNYVKIYQGVTLGALSVKKEDAKTKRHPTIEDNVIIYANSTILGGETVIGRDSIIGGNTWLVESVPPNSFVYAEHTTKVRERKD